MKEGRVIGPISRDDFYFMGQIKESIEDMKSKYNDKYDLAIRAHTDIYNRELKDIVNR